MTDIAHTLRGEGHDASEDGTGRGTPLVVAVCGTITGESILNPNTESLGGGGLYDRPDAARGR